MTFSAFILPILKCQKPHTSISLWGVQLILMCLLFTQPLNCSSQYKNNNDEDKLPSLSDTVDSHSVFNQPLTRGVYSFTEQGFIPAEPFVRIRKIHKEMMHTIQSIHDQKKQVKYLLTLSNTANNDLTRLRQKMEDSGIKNTVGLDKKALKADAFVLLISHGVLTGNSILYFPDIMDIILKKNADFESNVKWVIQFASDTNIINDTSILKLFHLVKQEIGMIPKEPDYQNPYKARRVVLEPPSTTTKKPRKRLQRGPRLSGGEL